MGEVNKAPTKPPHPPHLGNEANHTYPNHCPCTSCDDFCRLLQAEPFLRGPSHSDVTDALILAVPPFLYCLASHKKKKNFKSHLHPPIGKAFICSLTYLLLIHVLVLQKADGHINALGLARLAPLWQHPAPHTYSRLLHRRRQPGPARRYRTRRGRVGGPESQPLPRPGKAMPCTDPHWRLPLLGYCCV